MFNQFRAIRQFERFLFRGVPEQPESAWQRDDVNAHVVKRLSGRSQLPGQEQRSTQDNLICTIVYRPTLREVEIRPSNRSALRQSKQP